jgi:Protein-disulfide isomerase
MRRREFLTAGAAATAALGLASPARGQTGLTVEMVHFDPLNPVLGNPEGDVTIVEFFDYQCPWCKKGHPDVMRAVEDDGKVRLLMRDWPIFGEASLHASRLVLAAGSSGYRPALEALFETEGALTTLQVDALLTGAGFDVPSLEASYVANVDAIEGLLERNMSIAQGFGFSGTPSFVVGTQVFFGYLDRAALDRAIAAARG